jgi:8-oxo-dGTP pyrophosphatase MutT (NUDIX family)
MPVVQFEHVERALAAHVPFVFRSRTWVARASVALVLTDGAEGARVLLVRRAERRGDPWSGHLAFPGGVALAGEDSGETAVREAREETGLELGGARRIGRLSDLLTLTHGGTRLLIVSPWVFVQDAPCALQLGPELSAVAWSPSPGGGSPRGRDEALGAQPAHARRALPRDPGPARPRRNSSEPTISLTFPWTTQ